ncbi:phospholipase D-like domain-containing protein [Geopsychrobacter electrodiphilus]|uniref:phospholipase D-like domain-containing protein n=1 Tax=Geopsychrobacter electrodiphilus TaxID=225196 RepID=UPI00047794ED|nr:phospholipase D-like domain-containing protein [Geopsychrobacter electrodiphilus]
MTWFLSHIVLLLGFCLALVVIARMIRQRRSPAGSLAWLLIMVLVPYFGIPLYLMLGGRKTRRLADSKTDLALQDQQSPPPQEIPEIDRLLRSYGIPGASAGNRVQLCLSGEEGYTALTELIDQARESLWVSTFILSPDVVGRDIIERLACRAAAGIKVKVLLDGVGSLHTGKHALAPLRRAGGEVAFFMPVLHRPFRGRTNLRNHRKAVIADDLRVWAGGTNIAAEYIGPIPVPERWCDLSFLLEGPATRHYLSVFDSDWQFATGREHTPPQKCPRSSTPAGNAILQVVPSGPDVNGDPLYAALISAVFQARERLWIVTPYFIPDETLAEALNLAAHRGVDVQVLVPAKSNHRLADMARGPYLRDLQAAGGQIQLYQPGMLHAKALLADNHLAILGSANFDMRSLFLNYETGLLIYSPSEIKQVHAWIETILHDCRSGIGTVGVLRDLSEGVARMLAPML